ncbi:MULTISPECIES: ribonuclease J [Brachybacterium]|uniref:Ribonuclease J n=1 Tax=Brachybacterium fresconis TaxID=173363 RepID=A0ABS4YK60_9MICO|nr:MULTISPECIES: ribonuclease J [Brachybacterium]MBP2409187.1 ribonuclease J [Brachybacterium fresconis]MDN5685185.1 ribonuclease J [Brachybacterium sp.]
MPSPTPKLSAPARLRKNGMRITALGGLGEVGRNMTVFEFAGKLLIVDCGVLFPEDHQPGIDVILPDFTSIRDRLDDIEAIVLTHGHEDHIGGVPYLLKERSDIPLIGSELTLAFITAKLKEHRITPKTIQVEAGEHRKAGAFDLEFVAVNHSIPDALAVAIRTKAGLVLHTGDFKMDQFPLDGRITDLRAFSRLGEEGVDLFLTDSTNAEVPGFTISERDLNPAIDQVFTSSPRRIIVSSFASHVHRIQQVLDAAHANGRKVAFVGRSMVRNMGIARDLGYLNIPKGLVVDFRKIQSMPDHKITLICTGSQGEPMAALARMANGDHQIRVGEDDTVLMASSLIPGNENAIYGIINKLTDLGANIVHKGNAKVHVSGHASAGELVYCYNIVRPSNVMPVHGESKHLHANAELARRTGVPEQNIVIAQDGVTVDLIDGKARVSGKVEAGLVYVDGQTIGTATEDTLAERRQLSGGGVVTVVALINPKTNQTVEPLEFLTKGFVHDKRTFEGAEAQVTKALARAQQDKIDDIAEIEEIIVDAVSSYLRRSYRREPTVMAVVVDA